MYFCFLVVFLPKPQGSLHRVGHYIDYTPNYRNHLFKKINQVTRNFKYFSEVNIQKENSFSVLTLGDSFSKQAEYGYQNYLESDSISVLHYNKNINAIATLNNLINGDLFEKIDVDFLVLSAVKKTLSHPNISPIGWKKFKKMANKSSTPIYALGGLGDFDYQSAIENGGIGIASQRLIWK